MATVLERPRYDRSIVEGPLQPAVWKIAWPSMLTNVVGGLQGIVDHALVGHLVGFTGNAAIGVSWQIILVVIVFISSLFSGMSVLVSRFAGAGDSDKVDRTVYQAFLTATFLSFGVMAPLGYLASPWLLDFVNAAPAVKAEALPFLRIMFVFIGGMMMFFMLGAALRSAGDARTPMMLGIAMTVLNLVLNVILIRGLGPIPSFGTKGSAMGTAIASGLVAIYSLWKLWSGGWVVRFPHGHGFGPDWRIIRSLFRFGLPTGIQGIAMNVGGVLMLAFIGSLPAERRGAGGVRRVLYAAVFADHMDVGGIDGRGRRGGRTESRRRASRSRGCGGARGRALWICRRGGHRILFSGLSAAAARDIRHERTRRRRDWRAAASRAERLRIADRRRADLYRRPSGDGRHQEPALISIVSQIVVPLGICFVIQRTATLDPIDIWIAILIGHATRCVLSVLRFNQGKWRHIAVDLEEER